jgi:hypothetical protein
MTAMSSGDDFSALSELTSYAKKLPIRQLHLQTVQLQLPGFEHEQTMAFLS